MIGLELPRLRRDEVAPKATVDGRWDQPFSQTEHTVLSLASLCGTTCRRRVAASPELLGKRAQIPLRHTLSVQRVAAHTKFKLLRLSVCDVRSGAQRTRDWLARRAASSPV